MNKQLQACTVFRQLHAGKPGWIIPNPWDVGSAKILVSLGFKALATTSGGYALSLGKPDGAVTLEEMMQHCTALTAATDVPINADFENGYAEDIDTMAENIKRLAATGVAGISIEDFSRESHSIYPIPQAVTRVEAAVAAIKATGVPIMLTARAEGLLRGSDDLDDIITRLQAFEQAGADVLYAPAVKSLADLETITGQIGKPFNALASFLRKASVQQLVAAGANRISVGGALTYAAMAPLLEAGTEMQQQGTFHWMDNLADGAAIRNALDT